MTTPLTPAQRVRRAEAKAKASGARRLPNGMLDPLASAALDRLAARNYAPSLPAIISRSLMEADKRQKR